MQAVGNNIKELQSLNVTVTVLKGQITMMEQQAKENQADRRELCRELQRLRDQATPERGKRPEGTFLSSYPPANE